MLLLTKKSFKEWYIFKVEGLPEVVESQANDIEELKITIETIQAHVISHIIWQKETDTELALLPKIRDNQELLMFHVADLIKSLSGDDAKNGEGALGSRSQQRLVKKKQTN